MALGTQDCATQSPPARVGAAGSANLPRRACGRHTRHERPLGSPAPTVFACTPARSAALQGCVRIAARPRCRLGSGASRSVPADPRPQRTPEPGSTRLRRAHRPRSADHTSVPDAGQEGQRTRLRGCLSQGGAAGCGWLLPSRQRWIETTRTRTSARRRGPPLGNVRLSGTMRRRAARHLVRCAPRPRPSRARNRSHVARPSSGRPPTLKGHRGGSECRDWRARSSGTMDGRHGSQDVRR
jgi:hypothetical protein